MYAWVWVFVINYKLFQVPKQTNVNKFISGVAASFYIVLNCDFNINCVFENENVLLGYRNSLPYVQNDCISVIPEVSKGPMTGGNF